MVFVLALSLLASWTAAQTTRPSSESAIEPRPRDAKWVQRHEGFVKIAKQGGVDLLFMGDSITDGWRGGGKKVWQANFAPLKAANFGIGGDRTQHVLWRMLNGELDGIQPKLVVLMIGTNNLRSNSDEEITEGVTTIVREFQKRTPQSKILLLGIFPRAVEASDPARARIKNINAMIAKLDDGGKKVRYLDIGQKFLTDDGTLTKEIMPDALHPNEKGYEIWAAAIVDVVNEMLK